MSWSNRTRFFAALEVKEAKKSITREHVREATARFLARGGSITKLKDEETPIRVRVMMSEWAKFELSGK